jgi:hypothetical protein
MDATQEGRDAESDKDQRPLRLIYGARQVEGGCPTAGGYR